jgi:hypothetical protein
MAVLVAPATASSFDVRVRDSSVSSCPCTANTVKVDIENMYKSADTFYLSLDLPSGWDSSQAFVQPDLMLSSGDSETIPVYITMPCMKDPGLFRVVLNVESSATNNEISREIPVQNLKCFFVSMDIDETYRELCLENGEGKTFDVTIENEGKKAESYILSTDKAWAVFSDSSVELDSGESRTIRLTLDMPDDSEGMQTINLHVHSEDSYAQDKEQIRVNVEDCYAFEASLLPSEVQGDGQEDGEQNDSGQGSQNGQSDGTDDGSSSDGDQNVSGDGITGQLTGGEYPWETMIVSIIIIIVVLAIIYIIVKR